MSQRISHTKTLLNIKSRYQPLTFLLISVFAHFITFVACQLYTRYCTWHWFTVVNKIYMNTHPLELKVWGLGRNIKRNKEPNIYLQLLNKYLLRTLSNNEHVFIWEANHVTNKMNIIQSIFWRATISNENYNIRI